MSDATSYIDKGFEFQRKFYFSANGSELWRTDGTPVGIVLVGDISLPGGSFPSSYCALNNKLLFEAFSDALDHELYKYEDPEFLPCENELTLTGLSARILYEANSTIVVSQTIPSLLDFTILKAKSITLNPGFKTESAAKFTTVSVGCHYFFFTLKHKRRYFFSQIDNKKRPI